MRVCEKAYRYVIRKRGKSILLGSVFAISLLVTLIGHSLLNSFELSLIEIGKKTNAQITVFSNMNEKLLTKENMKQLIEKENIVFVNRTNEVTIQAKNLDVSLGTEEVISDGQVMLQGFDDLTRDSLFARQITQIGNTDLQLKHGEIFIHETLALMNGLEEKDTIIFLTKQGTETKATIKGIYSYIDPYMENEERTPSSYRFENLIFANIDWMDEVQGQIGYIGAHFYLLDPYHLEETRLEFTEVLQGSGFETGVLDATFRRMSQPLIQTKSIVQMILSISIIATLVITFLLLSLWARERKKEVALLVSVGESRILIIAQRVLETIYIYIVAIAVSIMLANILAPYLSKDLLLIQLESIKQFETIISLKDSVSVGITGLLIIVAAVLVSCIPVLKFTPRAIFSEID